MGKGGGGGVSTAGLENATKEATELQKQIYEQTRSDVQPWYNLGVGATGRLADLLGVAGGSMQTRDQIAKQVMPAYTTQTQASGGNLIFNPRTGETFDVTSELTNQYGNYYGSGDPLYNMFKEAYQSGGDIGKLAQEHGYSVGGGYTPAGTTTDYAAMNAEIDKRMAGQETPSDYGSLLQRFGMEQYEEDPGYQFRKAEANKAVERQMAAQGVTLGGGGYGEINPQAYRAMQELNQGLASQEYQSAYNRYVNDQLNTFNMLTGASGLGTQVTGQMSGAGQNYATNVGNLQTGLASAQMNAQLAQASRPSMFGSLLGLGAQGLGAYLGGGGTLSGLFG